MLLIKSSRARIQTQDLQRSKLKLLKTDILSNLASKLFNCPNGYTILSSVCPSVALVVEQNSRTLQCSFRALKIVKSGNVTISLLPAATAMISTYYSMLILCPYKLASKEYDFTYMSEPIPYLGNDMFEASVW